MRTTQLTLAAALLLAAAIAPPAWGQRRVVPANAGRVGVVRGSAERPAAAPRRPARSGEIVRAAPRPAERSGPIVAPAAREPEGSRWGSQTYGRHDPASRFPRRYSRYPGTHYPYHGLHVGARFGSAFIVVGAPLVYPVYLYPAPYLIRYSGSGSRTVLQGDVGAAGDALVLERLPADVLRLSWRPDGRSVDEVGLFLADAGQQVLAIQTLYAPPFAALLQSTARAAYVGVTVAYADGQRTTTLLPLR